MNQKLKQTTSTEKQLLQAREEGLSAAREIHAMQAYGKFKGMDVFFWNEPELDTLANVITSFPFPVFWIGKHHQIEECIKAEPSLTDNIDGLIVYDNGRVNISREGLNNISKVLCVSEVNDALEVFKAMNHGRNILLFTTEGQERKTDRESFEKFLGTGK